MLSAIVNFPAFLSPDAMIALSESRNVRALSPLSISNLLKRFELRRESLAARNKLESFVPLGNVVWITFRPFTVKDFR